MASNGLFLVVGASNWICTCDVSSLMTLSDCQTACKAAQIGWWWFIQCKSPGAGSPSGGSSVRQWVVRRRRVFHLIHTGFNHHSGRMFHNLLLHNYTECDCVFFFVICLLLGAKVKQEHSGKVQSPRKTLVPCSIGVELWFCWCFLNRKTK